MGRAIRAMKIAPLALSLLLTACASGKKSLPPPVDPVKEQITILQKQLLELQNVQNETRRKLDEQANAVNALNARINALEATRSAPPPAQSSEAAGTTSAARTAPIKAPSKKKRTAKKRASQQTKTP